MNISSDDLELFLIEFKEALSIMSSGLNSLEEGESGNVNKSVGKLYDALSGLMGIVDFIECNTLTVLCNQLYSCILKLKKNSSLWDTGCLSLFKQSVNSLESMYKDLEEGKEPSSDLSDIINQLKQLAESLSGQKESAPVVNPDEEELLFDEMTQMISSFSVAVDILMGNSGDQDAMFECYKSAHTLKGFGAMIGFDPLNQLATVTEKLFFKAREGELEIDEDILFLCKEVDSQLKLMKDDLLAKRVNTYDNEELVADIKSFFVADDNIDVSVVDITSDPIEIDDEIKRKIDNISSREGSFYDVVILLGEEIEMKSVRCYQYLERLKEIGEVIAVSPLEVTITDPGFICKGVKTIFFSMEMDEIQIVDVLKQVEEAKTMIVTKREV